MNQTPIRRAAFWLGVKLPSQTDQAALGKRFTFDFTFDVTFTALTS